jgi:hypothetical protein
MRRFAFLAVYKRPSGGRWCTCCRPVLGARRSHPSVGWCCTCRRPTMHCSSSAILSYCRTMYTFVGWVVVWSSCMSKISHRGNSALDVCDHKQGSIRAHRQRWWARGIQNTSGRRQRGLCELRAKAAPTAAGAASSCRSGRPSVRQFANTVLT